MKDNEIIYFELNDWFPERDYPNEEPFNSWMEVDIHATKFEDEEWVKTNKLCVAWDLVDMSINVCVTATKKWVEEICPNLLTKHTKFLRTPNEDGKIIGQWGHPFLEYKEENIGVTKLNLGL